MDYEDYKAGKSESSFWFKGKRNLIFTILKKNLIKKNLKILSIGAGTGDELKILNKFGDVYVVDINKKALDLIPKNLYSVKKICNAIELPFEDKTFDLVVSFDVFEHIKEDYLATKEAYRVLKKDGILFFSVPAFQFLYSSHDRALGHNRRYSKKQLKSLLKSFKKIKLFYWNFFLFLPISFIRLIKKNSKPKVDDDRLNLFLDSLFFKLLKLENFFIFYELCPPFGISIFGVCKK